MRINKFAIFLILALTFKTVTGQTPPDVIARNTGGNAWVSAKALTTTAGAVVWKKDNSSIYEGPLIELAAEVIEKSIQTSARLSKKTDNGETVCSVMSRVDFHPISPINFAEVLQNSQSIYEVSIEGLIPGYFLTSPGALLSVRTETTLGNPKFERPEVFHLYYGNARFMVGDIPVCTENTDYFFPPTPGLRLLIFSKKQSLDVDGAVFLENPFYIFAETPDGGYSMTQDLLGSPTLKGVETFDELKIRAFELKGQQYKQPNRQNGVKK